MDKADNRTLFIDQFQKLKTKNTGKKKYDFFSKIELFNINYSIGASLSEEIKLTGVLI
jgi:hypothetical protein